MLPFHIFLLTLALSHWIYRQLQTQRRLQLLFKSPQRQGYGLSADQAWITWNDQNVLWLLPEYRVSLSLSLSSYVRAKRLSK